MLLGLLDPGELISKGGYALLFAIVFAESGLLIGFFLPGDSLLFTAGAISAGVFADEFPDVRLNIVAICIGCVVAAVAGDQVGYMIGKKAGPVIFDRPDSKLFNQKRVDKSHEFFEKHGPKAIVLARFVPVIRPFVPTLAGVSQMDYPTFARFNAVGGLLWGGLIPVLGYTFGGISIVRENFEVAVVGIVLVSFLPLIYEVGKAALERRAERKAAAAAEH